MCSLFCRSHRFPRHFLLSHSLSLSRLFAPAYLSDYLPRSLFFCRLLFVASSCFALLPLVSVPVSHFLSCDVSLALRMSALLSFVYFVQDRWQTEVVLPCPVLRPPTCRSACDLLREGNDSSNNKTVTTMTNLINSVLPPWMFYDCGDEWVWKDSNMRNLLPAIREIYATWGHKKNVFVL